MFGSLIAHEARLQWRPLAVASAVALGVGLLAMVLQALQVPLASTVAYITGTAVAVGYWVGVLVSLLVAYGRTMHGRQGYFTMMIPVDGGVLYAAKFLWAWLVGCAALAYSLMLGLLVLVGQDLNQGAPAMRSVVAALESAFAAPGAQGLLILLVAVIGQAVITAFWGFVVTLGSGPKFNRFGFVGVVLVGVFAYFAAQLLLLLSILAMPWGMYVDGEGIRLVVHWFARDLLANADTSPIPLGWIPTALVGGVVMAWVSIRQIRTRTSLR